VIDGDVDDRVLPMKSYRLEYAFDGVQFHPTPETASDVKLFETVMQP